MFSSVYHRALRNKIVVLFINQQLTNHILYFSFLLAWIVSMHSHTHLLVGDMCSRAHLFVRCFPVRICSWDAFMYTSAGGLCLCACLLVICVPGVMCFCTYLLVICVPKCICWQRICWWYAFPYAFDGNVFTHTHCLARCTSKCISWQDALLHASVGYRYLIISSRGE